MPLYVQGPRVSRDKRQADPQTDVVGSGRATAAKPCPAATSSGAPSGDPSPGAATADAVVELNIGGAKSYQEFIEGSLASNEAHRLEVLTDLDLRATAPRPELATITELIKSFFDVPLALVGIVDDQHTSLYAHAGSWAGTPDLPRDFTICQHLTLCKEPRPLIIEDVLHDVRWGGWVSAPRTENAWGVDVLGTESGGRRSGRGRVGALRGGPRESLQERTRGPALAPGHDMHADASPKDHPQLH